MITAVEIDLWTRQEGRHLAQSSPLAPPIAFTIHPLTHRSAASSRVASGTITDILVLNAFVVRPPRARHERPLVARSIVGRLLRWRSWIHMAGLLPWAVANATFGATSASSCSVHWHGILNVHATRAGAQLAA